MSTKYKRSKKWIGKKLDEIKTRSIIKLNRQPLIIIADTTFFSRTDGLCVFREPNLKKNVWWNFTDYERTSIYEKGRRKLEDNGFKIKAIVLDGKRGIRGIFSDIPVQMCHFHQTQIVNRYLTLKPKLEASIELRNILKTLINTNEKIFKNNLDNWNERWKDFLKQKTINKETGKWNYTHKRVRSAFRSLKTNLSFLFTYQKYPYLKIPNTTNSLDGYFNSFKNKLNIHRGLIKKRRNKIIIELLKGENSLK